MVPDVDCETAYERSDAPPWLLAALAAAVFLSIGIVLGGVAIGFPHALVPYTRGPLQPLPPQPRLQSAPASDLAAYRQAERKTLTTYGRTGNGHVRVPVDQAMRAVAAQGWGGTK
jgi:hypothetical protein